MYRLWYTDHIKYIFLPFLSRHNLNAKFFALLKGNKYLAYFGTFVEGKVQMAYFGPYGIGTVQMKYFRIFTIYDIFFSFYGRHHIKCYFWITKYNWKTKNNPYTILKQPHILLLNHVFPFLTIGLSKILQQSNSKP